MEKLIDLTREQLQQEVLVMQQAVERARIQAQLAEAFDQGQISVLQKLIEELPPTRL